MRLFLCAAALAMLEHCIAAPSFRSSGNGAMNEQVQPETVDEETLKYFHEPGTSETLAHYDRRFFTGVATDEERMDAQSHMVRAYLTFFREHGLDTWIAHGTLLGWWWNGKRLPWDVDLDTQVSHATLLTLGSTYNQTRYTYVFPTGAVKRTYLLDVNPWISEREHGNGMNVIDARWIDVRNGLYIDITGLSEMRPGVWACKNNHEYATKELWPMRETVFEGTRATVPFEYDAVLTGEYREAALVRTEFNGHNWDPKTKEWIKSEWRAREDEREREKMVGERRKKITEKAKLV